MVRGDVNMVLICYGGVARLNDDAEVDEKLQRY
jgi:hypothetical protein